MWSHSQFFIGLKICTACGPGSMCPTQNCARHWSCVLCILIDKSFRIVETNNPTRFMQHISSIHNWWKDNHSLNSLFLSFKIDEAYKMANEKLKANASPRKLLSFTHAHAVALCGSPTTPHQCKFHIFS